MRKKLFAVIMSAMMMVTFMPAMAFAAKTVGYPAATPNYEHGQYYVDGTTDADWFATKWDDEFVYDGQTHKVWLYATKIDETDVSVDVTYSFWKYDASANAYLRVMKDSAVAPVVKNVGHYKIQATATWTKRLGGEDSCTYPAMYFGIAPKIATVKAVSPTLTKEYDGLGFQMKDSLFTITGLVSGDVLFTDKQLTNSDVGEYYVYAADVEANTNYYVNYVNVFTNGSAIISITPAKNVVTFTTSATKSFKATKVAKAKKTFTVNATATAGTVKFSKVSGSKKLTLNKTTGKITVKKGTKKGTYKIKVKASVPASKNFMAGSVTKTFTVKVK